MIGKPQELHLLLVTNTLTISPKQAVTASSSYRFHFPKRESVKLRLPFKEKRTTFQLGSLWFVKAETLCQDEKHDHS